MSSLQSEHKKKEESKRPKLSWNTYQRQFLCCLWRFFHCGNYQVSAIFSKVFRHDLIQCGFGNQNIPYRTLHAQWSWLRRQRRPVWFQVHVDTEFSTQKEWKDIIHLIRLTASQLGLTIHDKKKDTILIPGDTVCADKEPSEALKSILLACYLRPQEETFWSSEGTMKSHIGDVQEQSRPASEPANPNRTHESFEPLVTSHGKVCFWCAKENAIDCAFVIPDTSSDEDGQATPIARTSVNFELQNDQEIQITPGTPCQAFEQPESCPDDIPHIMDIPGIPGLCGSGDTPKPPELLYRWSNNHSQGINTGNLLVAGLFVKNYPQVPSPYQCSVDEFLRLFKVHVTRKKVPTPFISAFARPIAPLHRALRNGHQAKITLIDTCIMPSLQGYVFSAQPLAQITDTIVDRWKGYGEYAIWGSIPREAIVTTFSLADIEKIARDDPEVRQFLQLDLIRGEATCHRGLRRKLRENLRSLRIEDNRPALRRLAWHLDVPEEWHEVFTQDMHDAWTMDLGGNNQVLEGEGDLPMVQDEAWPGPLGQAFMNAVRSFRESSETTISYIAPLSDGGSPSEPTSEEHESPSQSPIAANRRRDTPSSTYSMESDSDDSFTLLVAQNALRTTDADIAELAVPRGPDQTSRHFDQPDRLASIIHSPGSDMLGLPAQVPLDHDPSEASDWPSDGEIHFGSDTPRKCHYLSRPLSQITRDRDGDIARLPDLGASGKNASIFDFGDNEQSSL